MRVGPFWGGALVLAVSLAACSSMKAAILGSDEENKAADASEFSGAHHPPVGAYGVANEPLASPPAKVDADEATAASAKDAPSSSQPPASALRSEATPNVSSAPAPAASTSTPTPPAASQSPSSSRVATSVAPAKLAAAPVEGIPVKPLSKKELEQDAKRDFDRASELLKNGQESQALVSLTDFLRRYPEHKLVGDAQFYIGEIFFRQRKYAEALHELQKVKDLLKGESQKTPDAFVKIGECQLKLGNVDRARIEWNAVKRRFAGTPAALQADVLLKGLPR